MYNFDERPFMVLFRFMLNKILPINFKFSSLYTTALNFRSAVYITLCCSLCVLNRVRLTFISLDLSYVAVACLKLLESGYKATELLNSLLLIANFFMVLLCLAAYSGWFLL